MSKRVIRRSVFETNSSSVHSVSISNNDLQDSHLTVNDDGYIEVDPGEFGWGVESFTDQTTKLEYLVMMAMETEGKECTSIEEFYQTEGFQHINREIACYCNCKGIIVPELKIEKHTYKTDKGEERFYINHEGYIDHQSCENYGSLKEFLDDYRTTVIEFVFNPGAILHISNDNQ